MSQHTSEKEHMMSNAAMGGMGQSTVSSCDVTNCTYNKAQQCTAGSIQVSFVSGMAHCATYSPEGGAMGMASDSTTSTSTTTNR
jgi:hypothetical protein